MMPPKARLTPDQAKACGMDLKRFLLPPPPKPGRPPGARKKRGRDSTSGAAQVTLEATAPKRVARRGETGGKPTMDRSLRSSV